MELKPCPFCGGKAHIQLTDDEGNLRSNDYLDNAYSGISYAIMHTEEDVPNNLICPICTFEDETVGTYRWDTEKEAIEAWNRR